MNLTLFRKILRDIRWPFLGVCFLLGTIQIIRALITYRITVEVLPELMKRIPYDALMKIIFGGKGKFLETLITAEGLQFNKPEHMQTFGFVDPGVVVIFCIWAIGRGSAIAAEMERGTMELLLAQPIARWQIIASHLCVDLLTVPLMALTMIAGTWIGVEWMELNTIDVSAYWGAVLNVIALLWALIGLTTALAAMSRTRWRVMSMAISIVLVMFLLTFLGQLVEVFKPWRFLSLFHYYQPQGIILYQRWKSVVYLGYGSAEVAYLVPKIPTLLLSALGCYSWAFYYFTRRDLPAPL